MDFNDSPKEAEFRQHCRSWLEDNAQLKQQPDQVFGEGLPQGEVIKLARQWQATKARAGFGAITWPQQLGGLGGTPVQEVIYRQEEAHFNVPTGIFNVSLGMVLPSLLAHASPDMLAQHVQPALMGDALWCQLLSEPGAGSDLGMVRTRAERATDGRNGWIINGQKVWTTLAQYAEFGLVLTRTDADCNKFAGLTSFYVQMDTPGIEVRPIKQANGASEFNEVFFNDVFVPDEQRIGDTGDGWKVTLTGLMSERLSIGGVMPPELWKTTARLMQTSSRDDFEPLADGQCRRQLADLYLNAQGLWLLQCRGLTALGQGKAPGPELSVAKIVAARTLQDFSYFAMDLQGQSGLLSANEQQPGWELVERLWMGSAGMRIAGGTDEIVKNNVGERVLGLPPEPKLDKGKTFKELTAS